MHSVKQLNVNQFEFKNAISFQKRRKEAAYILEKYVDRISTPTICQFRSQGPLAMTKKNRKYLTPKELTPTQFLFIIRKRLEFSSEKGLFLFLNGYAISSNTTFDLESCTTITKMMMDFCMFIIPMKTYLAEISKR